MSQAAQLALGSNIPLTITGPRASVALSLSDTGLLEIPGGSNGQALVSDGLGHMKWGIDPGGGLGWVEEAPATGGPYARQANAWTAIVSFTGVSHDASLTGNGTQATPLSVATLDAGTF